MLWIRSAIGWILNHVTILEHKFAPPISIFDENIQAISSDRKWVILATHTNEVNEIMDLVGACSILKQNSFRLLVVNTGKLIPSQLESLNKGFLYRERSNTGRDFGSFKFGLLLIFEATEPQEIILMNDSMTWNEENMELIFNSLNCRALGVSSITESFQRGYHLQSYFLWFHDEFSIKHLKSFFSKVRGWHWKRTVVFRGELALSRYLTKYSVPLKPLFTALELWEYQRKLSAKISKLQSSNRRSNAINSMNWKKVNPENFFRKELWVLSKGLSKKRYKL